MNLKKVRGKAERVRFLSAVIVFILISIVMHLLLPIFSGLIKNKHSDLKFMVFHFMEIKYFKIWIYGETFALILSVYVWIIGDKPYVSDEIQVTDKIRIPAPAGQGQYGSARFASSKEIDEFFDYIDFNLSEYDSKLSKVYEYNSNENRELAKITDLELLEYEDREKLVDILNDGNIRRNEKNIDEIVKYVGNRKDIRFILKSNLSLNDLKRIDIKDIKFDEYYAKLSPDEFNEAIIAMNKVKNTLKKNLIYEYMVKVRYENIEQLREIRYAIEDGISGGYIQLFADNTYSADKLKQIRLAYKSEKIRNKRLIEKYLLNSRLSRNQMEEIRKALIQDVSNIEGIAHDEIPDELMRKLRETETGYSEETGQFESRQEEVITGNKATYSIKKEKIKEVVSLCDKGGLVLGKENLTNGKERIYLVNSDLHTLTIGETGSGKTRTMVLQSIVSLGLAGENMVITDIKGELSEFTMEFLKNIGYETVFLDFKNPLKSTRFNFLKPVIDAVNKDDIDSAVELIWDITAQLVGEEIKGEPIWQNGEAAVIAGAIMAVVYDNRERQEYQNFANVYNFLAEMCKPVQIGREMILPINEYANNLDYTHPAKGIFAIGEIAPSRTRGSFYTSALTTLRLFTSQRLADMTSEAEFELNDLAVKKMAVFIILPEDRSTYNQIASLYVGLQYQSLSKMADRTGGRLKIRCNCLLDEFGNFPAIPNFLQMITVSRGKGVRFNLFLQDLSQLIRSYEKEGTDTICGNCQIWIYLRTGNKETLELISAKLSQYTVSSSSLSGSTEINKNPSSSFSKQLSGRNLLLVNELALFSSPYSLVLSKINPAVMKSDDFSKWQFVRLLNMGDKDRDTKVRYYRQKKRKERIPKRQEYWSIKDEIISNMRTGGDEYV